MSRAQPRTDIAVPLSEPAPWVFIRPATGDWVVVVSKSWFEAREKAPLAYAEHFGGEPPSDLELKVNPVREPELARKMARRVRWANGELAKATVKAECVHVETEREFIKLYGWAPPKPAAIGTVIRVNGSAVPWGEGFDPKQEKQA